MASLRRLLRAARAYPAVTIAAMVVLLVSAAGTAAVVVATDDDDTASPSSTTSTTTVEPTTSAPPATTTAAPPTTTGAGPTTTAAPTTTTRAPGQRCLVRLHGKGGGEADTYTDEDGVTVITPNGNESAPGWGDRQWIYFPNGKYNQARDVVEEAIDDEDCDTVIINGFSNGGAFAAKLYCRGETFDERVIRYVVDDPVVDEGVVDCAPDDSADVVLYWTGSLESTAQPGWDCEDEDWTCEGGQTIGIEAYANAMGTPAKASEYSDHKWYQEAPELSEW
jgi:pimeloyl-ACP methyl ester carboxylesterase